MAQLLLWSLPFIRPRANKYKAWMPQPHFPCLCQPSLMGNRALPTEASLSLIFLITVPQENGTRHLNLHLGKYIFARKDLSHSMHHYQKTSLKYLSYDLTILIKISQCFHIACYLKPELSPKSFQNFLLSLFFPPFYSSM